MDSPTDKNPPDSGLLRLITDGPTDKSSGLLPSIWMVLLLMDSPTDKNPPDSGLRINPADCGLRTLDLSLALRTGLNTPNGGCKEFAKKPPKPIKGEGTATNTKYKSKYKGAKNIAWNLNKELSCFCFRELRRRFLHSLHRIERLRSSSVSTFRWDHWTFLYSNREKAKVQRRFLYHFSTSPLLKFSTLSGREESEVRE